MPSNSMRGAAHEKTELHIFTANIHVNAISLALEAKEVHVCYDQGRELKVGRAGPSYTTASKVQNIEAALKTCQSE